jgi:hypothetical protein
VTGFLPRAGTVAAEDLAREIVIAAMAERSKIMKAQPGHSAALATWKQIT